MTNKKPKPQPDDKTPPPPCTCAENALGDCDRCRHSIAYHVPLLGCMKCNCDEYS